MGLIIFVAQKDIESPLEMLKKMEPKTLRKKSTTVFALESPQQHAGRLQMSFRECVEKKRYYFSHLPYKSFSLVDR